MNIRTKSCRAVYAGLFLVLCLCVLGIGCGPSNLPIREVEPTAGIYGIIALDVAGGKEISEITGTITAVDPYNRPYLAAIHDSDDLTAQANSVNFTFIQQNPLTATKYGWYEFVNPALPAGVRYTLSLTPLLVFADETQRTTASMSIENPYAKTPFVADPAMQGLLGQLATIVVNVE